MINQERLVKEFCTLVSFDSESFYEREIADYLSYRLKTLGLKVVEDEAWRSFQNQEQIPIEKRTGNLYAYLPGRAALVTDGSENHERNGSRQESEKENEPILFSAHMDTVRPGKGKKPILHPDGRITSDGTTVLGADDAAGLAEILEMITVLQEEKLSHPPLEFVFCAAEEPYCVGSAHLDIQKIRSKKAYVLDLSGPVGLAAFAAPTILSVEIEITGKAAHAGFHPEDGVHAIEIAANAMSRIKNGRNSLGTTVNFGTIQGGIGQNIVPESCRITGEIRSLNHEDAIRQAWTIKRIFGEEAELLRGNVTVLTEERIHAFHTDEKSTVVKDFQKACRNLGLSGELTKTLGGSDLNQFSKHHIEGLVLANAMEQVHTTEEYTTVSELKKAAELILALAVQ